MKIFKSIVSARVVRSLFFVSFLFVSIFSFALDGLANPSEPIGFHIVEEDNDPGTPGYWLVAKWGYFDAEGNYRTMELYRIYQDDWNMH